jgi:hypothetical protein
MKLFPNVLFMGRTPGLEPCVIPRTRSVNSPISDFSRLIPYSIGFLYLAFLKAIICNELMIPLPPLFDKLRNKAFTVTTKSTGN